MGHCLSNVSGRFECMTVGAWSWHRNEVNVAEAQNSRDALRLSRLDFHEEARALEAAVALAARGYGTRWLRESPTVVLTSADREEAKAVIRATPRNPNSVWWMHDDINVDIRQERRPTT